MKRNFLILGLVVAFLLSAHSTFAQTTSVLSANATTTNCFDYYKFGSVQINLDPIVNHVNPGGVLQFHGVVINKNSYPIVDGSVYIKIFRNDSKNTRVNGFPVVDQFIAKDNLSLAANGTSSIEFNWIVPLNALSGDYQVATFFQSADEFSLLGLAFTNDIVGNTLGFKIDGTFDSGVVISKDDVTVAGQHFMFAAYPPTVSATGTIAISTVLINTTGQTQNIPVTWFVYKWDGLKKENLIEQKINIYPAKPGQTKVSFNVSDTNYPVYYVVAEADYKDSKTILDIRFVRESKSDVSLMLPAVTSYPLKKGVSATLFSCLHAVSLDLVSGGKLELSVVDQNGNLIDSLQYDGVISPGMMALKKDFIPTRDLTNFTVKANLYQDGVLKDSASMVYDCKNINPSLCQTITSSSYQDVLYWIVVILVALIIVFVIIMILGKKKGSIAIILILFALGFSHSAEAKTVQWNGVNDKTMTVYNYTGAKCLLFDTYNRNNNGTSGNIYDTHCNGGDTGWNTAGTTLSMGIQYGAEVIDTGPSGTSPDRLIGDGDTVNPGDHIRLRFIPKQNTDITWYGTGAYMGSPYGYWTYDGTAPDYIPADSDDTGVQGLNNAGDKYNLYMAMSVNPPSNSIVNLTGLGSCSTLDNKTRDGDGKVITRFDYYFRDCVVTATAGTTISPSFNFGATYAHFWQSKSADPTKTYLYSNKAVLSRQCTTIDCTRYAGMYTQCKYSGCTYSNNTDNLYAVSIPAQNITIPFSVAYPAPMPPIDVQGSCPSPGSSALVSWTAPSTPPTDYSLKITDVTAGGTPTTYNGITTINKTLTTQAGHSYTVDVWSNVGGATSATRGSSFTCSYPNSTSFLSASPDSVAYGGSSMLTSDATNITACTIIKSGTTVDTFSADASHMISNHTTSVTNVTTDTTYTLTCTGLGLDPAPKTVTITVTPIDGSCGTANNKAYPNGSSSYGSDTQCLNNGVSSNTSFPSVGTPASWTCSGTNGGSPSGTCSASQEGGGTSDVSCSPQVTDSTGHPIDPALFANIGQLVTWTADVLGGLSYKWCETFSCTSFVGPTKAAYLIHYSTVGRKTMYLKVGTNDPVPCTTDLTGLPIINDPNYRPF